MNLHLEFTVIQFIAVSKCARPTLLRYNQIIFEQPGTILQEYVYIFDRWKVCSEDSISVDRYFIFFLWYSKLQRGSIYFWYSVGFIRYNFEDDCTIDFRANGGLIGEYRSWIGRLDVEYWIEFVDEVWNQFCRLIHQGESWVILDIFLFLILWNHLFFSLVAFFELRARLDSMEVGGKWEVGKFLSHFPCLFWTGNGKWENPFSFFLFPFFFYTSFLHYYFLTSRVL